MFQISASPSVMTRFLPSGVSAMERRYDPVSLEIRRNSRPVAMSQIRAVLSSPPVARIFPSREKVTEATAPVWPEKQCLLTPDKVFHKQAPPLVVARRTEIPSGEKAATVNESPVRNRRISRLVAASQRIARGPSPTVRTNFLSAEMVADLRWPV